MMMNNWQKSLSLLERNERIFNFPLPIKQESISFAHTIKDIEETLEKTNATLQRLFEKKTVYK